MLDELKNLDFHGGKEGLLFFLCDVIGNGKIKIHDAEIICAHAAGKRYLSVDNLIKYCDTHNLTAKQINPYLESKNSALLTESKKMSYLVSRPEVSLSDLMQFVPRGTSDSKVIESAEISIKYKGYIDREKQLAAKIQRLEDLVIPEDFDFEKVSGLTIECRQKLKKYNPRTLAQASRISGVSPADISVLLVYFGR